MSDEPRMKAVREALMTLAEHAHDQQVPGGALYVVATPIGNVADLSVRAITLLHRVDLIACEDTRHAGHLLDRIGVRAPRLACHEHNERDAAERICARLAQGERVAYVSDAGTPGVSDPGARLVETVRAQGHAIVPVPGASAAVTALSAAGFGASGFHFVGFVPTGREARAHALAALIAIDATLVFYEAPHRVVATLDALALAFGADRRIVIARELTKRHETVHAARLGDAASWIAADPQRQRGEFVLVVEGAPARASVDDATLDRVLLPLMRALPLKQAVAVAAEISGLARNAIYARALNLKASAGE